MHLQKFTAYIFQVFNEDAIAVNLKFITISPEQLLSIVLLNY